MNANEKVIAQRSERFTTRQTQAPLKAALKASPKFASEKAERAYWESHDSTNRAMKTADEAFK